MYCYELVWSEPREWLIVEIEDSFGLAQTLPLGKDFVPYE